MSDTVIISKENVLTVVEPESTNIITAGSQGPQGVTGAKGDTGDPGTVDYDLVPLLAGRTGGQTINGDLDSGGNLTLVSTAHATKGKILFGTSAYDEVNNRLGIGNINPDARLTIGSGASGLSADAQVLISRKIDNTVVGNAHGYSDSSDVDRSGTIGYNSYDARADFQGANGYDHYAGFQYLPTFNQSGTAIDSYGLFVADPTGSGDLTNNYGIYINPLTYGTSKNFAIYTKGSTRSWIEGSLGIGTEGNNSTELLEVYTGGGVTSKLRLRQQGQNYWDFKSVASTTRFAIGDISGDYFHILNGGNIGIGDTTPASKLTAAGDIETTGSANGLILESPDGTRYRVTVPNGGASLTITAV